MEFDAKNNNLEVENLQLLDMSSEDDYLIDFPFRNSLEDLRLSVTFENTNARDDGFKQSEFVEPKRPSFLRKSLAWDSEFFTGAGVLDPEELSVMNKGLRKAELHQLPRIQENVRYCKSADSKSASNASKKVNNGSGNKLKAVSASKCESIKQRTIICSHISQSARCKDSTVPSSKPPKVFCRSKPPIVAKQAERTSLGSDTVEVDHKTRKSQSGPDLKVSKKSRLGGLSGPIPSITPPSKSASSGTLLGIKYSTLRCPSHDSSSSASSSSKSLSKSTRKNISSRNTKLGPSSSSVRLSLMSNCSSFTSPTRSVDEWSSDSLSSASFSSEKCYEPTLSLDTATTRHPRVMHNVTKASDLYCNSQDQSSVCQEIQEKRITSQPRERASTETGSVSVDSKRCGSVSVDSKRCGRTSGLRMPSPKIGFFDEEQVMQPIVRGCVGFHFGRQSPLPSINGPTSEKRPSRFRPAKPLQKPDLSPATERENLPKVGKTSMGSGLKAECPSVKGVSKNKVSRDRKTLTDYTGCVQGGSIHPFMKKHDEVASNLRSLQESQKENICTFEDQVNGLSRYFQGVDLNKDLVTEVAGKPNYSHPQFSEQIQGPPQILSKSSILSLPTTVELTSFTRTPLADKTSVSNRVGLSTESTNCMLIEKPAFHLSDTEKENI